MKTTIDEQGRITLDPEIQLRLGVHPGDEVVLETRGEECVITPARPGTGLIREGEVLVHRALSVSPETGLSDDRDERFQQLTEGLLP